MFCAVPFLPRQVLANIAHEAGVHRYVDSLTEVVRADSRFVAVHTKEGGERMLNLPGASTVSDAITGEEIGRGTRVPLSLTPDSTSIYELTTSASNVFPQTYAAFATNILQDLLELDGAEKLEELFLHRQERRRKQYVSRTTGTTLTDRVASVAQLLEGEGRMTTWEQLDDSRFILREHNCPILKVAKAFDHPCRSEIDLLEEILRAKVKRVNHIPEGDIACVYEIEGLDDGCIGCDSKSLIDVEQGDLETA